MKKCMSLMASLILLLAANSATAQTPPLSLDDLLGFYTLSDEKKVVKTLRGSKTEKIVSNVHGVYDHFTDSLTTVGVDARLTYWLILHDGFYHPFAIYQWEGYSDIIKYKFRKEELGHFREEMDLMGFTKIVDSASYHIYRGQPAPGITIDIVFDGDWRWGSVRVYRQEDFDRIPKPMVGGKKDTVWKSASGISLVPPEEIDTAVSTIAQMPQPVMSFEEMYKFFFDKIRYPPESRKNNIQGMVIMRFAVWHDGRITQKEIVRSPADDLSAEALRVFSFLPNWIPALVDGKRENLYYHFPVRLSYH